MVTAVVAEQIDVGAMTQLAGGVTPNTGAGWSEICWTVAVMAP